MNDLLDQLGHQHHAVHVTRRMRRHRRRRGRTLLVLFVTLLLVAAAVGGAYVGLRPLISSWTQSDDYAGEGTGAVTVEIQPGDSGQQIGQRLVDAQVVKSVGAFKTAFSANPKGGQIQPGSYRLHEHMKASAAVAMLLDPTSRLTVKLAIPEGMRVTDIEALIVKNTKITKADLDAALANPAALGLPAAANGNPEGFLFPATYQVDSKTTAVSLLQSMVQRSAQVLGDLRVPPDQIRNVVIMASLAEKEARHADDLGKVTRVLVNRLAQNKPLQLDSTVNYFANKKTITTTDADRATDSPYNTYLHAGLPAGPIGNPGEAALQAALNPTPGPWMYFVTVNPDTGETRFATTDAEHAANVKLFQQWLRAHPQG